MEATAAGSASAWVHDGTTSTVSTFPAVDTTDTAPSRPEQSVIILNRLQAVHSSSTQQHGESAAYLQPQRSQQVFPAPL